jgi:hypothetical protein
LPEEWKESIVVPLHKPGDEPDRSNFRGLLMSTTYKTLSNILLSRLTAYARKLQGIISADFDATGQLWSYSAFVKYLRKNGNTMKQCTRYL